MQYGIIRAPRETVALSREARVCSLTAFGPQAELLAGRCAPELSLLLCDSIGIAEAQLDARRRARDGAPFLIGPLLDDAKSVLSRAASLNIYVQCKDERQRHDYFASLATGTMYFNGSPLFANEIYTSEMLQPLSTLAAAGQGIYARSQTERARIETLLKTTQLYTAVAPFVDTSVPNTCPHRDAAYTVVWAPQEQAVNLATFSFALWHLERPAIFVCRGQIADTPHHFVTPDHAEDALVNAAVVIDTQISDPGTAMAFAGRGYGVAAARSCGAHEYVQGAATYDMYDYASIERAVNQAANDRRAFCLPTFDAVSTIQSTVSAAQPEMQRT